MPFLTTALVAGGLAAAGGLGAAALQSNAAGNAAKTQANAATSAAQLQANEAAQALQFQKQQYAQGQQTLAPWASSGTSALANLDYLLGINGPGSIGPGATPNGAAPVANPLRPINPAEPGAPGATRPTSPLQAPINATSRLSLPFNGAGSTGNFANLSALSNPGSSTAVPGGTPVTPGAYAPPSNLNSLVNPNLGAQGSLMQSYPGGPFVAPTGVTEQNDPGYQFRLQQGENALQNSAAARGGLLSGGTARDINDYAQNSASNEYGNVYNRALQTYGTNYNAFQQNQANQYNRLASLAGLGQTTAGTLGQLGQNAANNVSNTLLTSGAQQGQQLNNAAAATASGYVGSANAYGGALSGLGGNISNLLMLNSLLNQGGGGGLTPVGAPGANVPLFGG